MKEVKIIARKKTISTSTHKYLDDNGLKAINNYIEEYTEVADGKSFDEISNEFLNAKNLDTSWDITVEEVVE